MGAHTPRMTIGAAMKAARTGRRNQAEVAAALSAAGVPGGDQPTVSKWERDEQRPSLEQIAAVEEACGRPRGFVLIAAGFVELPASLIDTIEASNEVSEYWREPLRVFAQSAIQESQRE